MRRTGRPCSLVKDGALQHLVYHVLFIDVVVLRATQTRPQHLRTAAKPRCREEQRESLPQLEIWTGLQGPEPSSTVGNASCAALGKVLNLSVPRLPRPDNDNDGSLTRGL